MTARRTLPILILVLVAATVALLRGLEARVPDPHAAADHAPASPDETLAAFFFHTDERHVTCRAIETQSSTILHEDFAQELAEGRLQWAEINIDLPENAHYRDEFSLTHSALVLAEMRGGQVLRFASLDQAWELVQDPQAFRDYVDRIVARRLEKMPPS